MLIFMIQKKSHPVFKVPNLNAPNRKRVKDRWRKQRGIDNKLREKRSGYGATPGIGYRNSESVRNRRADGKLEILVRNEKDLITAIGKTDHVARFAANLSKRKRSALLSIASKNNIIVVNKGQ